MIDRLFLEKSYLVKRSSVKDISVQLGCSENKVIYWMDKYKIKRRSIGDAIYQKHNPNGDPFIAKSIKSIEDAKLMGLGLGLYWGEGTKANRYSVRLGNSDPILLHNFIKFLVRLFGVDKDALKFGLQIFTDINPEEALAYWCKQLDVKPSQFYKVHVTISGSIGTYRKKSRFGVVTVYFHNKKLRDLAGRDVADVAQG